MALAQPTTDFLFKPISVNLSFIGIDKFPKEQLQNAVVNGAREIQFDGVRQASEYGSRQQMNYTVFMKKYDQPSFYHPYAIDATIDGQPGKTRRFDLADAPFRIENIQNLLNGRQVEKLRFDRFSRKVDTYWYRVDFSKQERGEYPLREISASRWAVKGGLKTGDRASTLAGLISEYPLLENTLPGLRFQLAQNVAQGDAALVTVITEKGTVKGYLQLGNRPDKIDLLVYKDGKLVKAGEDLKKIERLPDQEQRRRRTR